MKKLSIIVLSFCYMSIATAQDITGEWYGILPGVQIRLVFHIESTTEGYSSTMDSPDQNAFGITVTNTSYQHPFLKLEINNIGIEYTGEFQGNIIAGTFKQGGFITPLNLSRETIEKKEVVRPQTPVKPYPYRSEDIVFENKIDNIRMAGTLTLPEASGKYPAVVLISGSGPQNRDEELFGHKPFYVLSDYLTRQGIAVLRFDDRGVGESSGDHGSATSFDFANDVEAAIDFLRTRPEVNHKKIGLIGHSEGGLIAPIVASRNRKVHFIVLLAGPGVPGEQILLMQNELIQRASGVSETQIQKTLKMNKGAYEIVKRAHNMEGLDDQLTTYYKHFMETEPELFNFNDGQLTAIINSLNNPWMKKFIEHDPATVLTNVKCAVLAVNGEKDLQVPPKENLAAIERALKSGKNKKVTIMELPNLNHMFQECETGLPGEYMVIEQTFYPGAMEEVARWILTQVK